jgi:hypothetical protein
MGINPLPLTHRRFSTRAPSRGPSAGACLNDSSVALPSPAEIGMPSSYGVTDVQKAVGMIVLSRL